MSTKRWIGVSFLLAAIGCDAGGEGSTGGGHGPSGGSEAGGGGTGGAAGGAGPGGAGGHGVVASWEVTSDMTVNGQDLEDAIASVAARHLIFDGQDYLAVILTDVPDLCEALQAGDCGDGPHVRLEIDLTGVEPGTYDIADGVVSAWVGDVPASCAGAGLGAQSGSVTFHAIELGAGGFVEVDFDLAFLAGHAEGTLVAPICTAR